MISLIFSSDMNLGIGKDDKIPWHINSEIRREDLQFFKQNTIRKIVIMGSKTWKSLNCKPLKDRINIVVTRDPIEEVSGVIFCDSPESAIAMAKSIPICETFVIGGASLYNYSFLNGLADQIIHSQLKNKIFDCDVSVNQELYLKFINDPNVTLMNEMITDYFVNRIYVKCKNYGKM